MFFKLRVHFLLFRKELHLSSGLWGLLTCLEVRTIPFGAILGSCFVFRVLIKVLNDFVLLSKSILDLEALNSFKIELFVTNGLLH